MSISNTKILMKKTMTADELKAFYNASRSQVGLKQCLGTRCMSSGREYQRRKAKKELRKMLEE